MRRPQLHAKLSASRKTLSALLFCSLGCGQGQDRVATSDQSARARAEVAIRADHTFEGRLLCETRLRGRVLMTFEENPSERGSERVDIDPNPIVVIDTGGHNAHVIERQPAPAGNHDASAIEILAPADVDSTAAVAIATKLVARESTLHCVISSQRAFIVEVVASAQTSEAAVRGQIVLVPRGGRAQVIGSFEELRRR